MPWLVSRVRARRPHTRRVKTRGLSVGAIKEAKTKAEARMAKAKERVATRAKRGTSRRTAKRKEGRQLQTLGKANNLSSQLTQAASRHPNACVSIGVKIVLIAGLTILAFVAAVRTRSEIARRHQFGSEKRTQSNRGEIARLYP